MRANSKEEKPKRTTVARVQGLSPMAWLADDNHIYVGRSIYLRSGKNEGQSWPNSGFGNPFRFDQEGGTPAKRRLLFRYVVTLAQNLQRSALLLSEFWRLRSKCLGCWCLDWDGYGDVPACHAAWLAKIVDSLDDARTTGRNVLVTEGGLITIVSPADQTPGIHLRRMQSELMFDLRGEIDCSSFCSNHDS